jgi:hypothetical protein
MTGTDAKTPGAQWMQLQLQWGLRFGGRAGLSHHFLYTQ